MFDRPRDESAASIAQRDGIALLTGKAFVTGEPITAPVPHDKRKDGKRIKGATINRPFRAYNCCEFCGEHVLMFSDWTFADGSWSAVKPNNRGEMDRIEAGEAYKRNIQIACRTCNAARQNKTIEEFVAQYAGKLDAVKLAASEAR
jgi:hypothetical protein